MAIKKPEPRIIIQYSENTLPEEEFKKRYESLIKLLVTTYLKQEETKTLNDL